MKIRLLPGLWLVLALPFSAPLQASDAAVERFRSVLIDYFAEQGFLPVILDRGFRIGDVVNVDGVNLYARGSTCFPRLKPPVPVKTQLPDVVHLEGAALSFGLKLRQLFSSAAGADLAKRIEVRFSDVTVSSATLRELRAALDRKACPEIAPLVDGTLSELSPGRRPYFVVSEVLSGQREARLEFSTRADLALKTRELAKLAGSAELAVSGMGDGVVTLASRVPGLLALKPVTVPNVVKMSSFSGGVRGGDEGTQWQGLDCPQGRSCWPRIEPLAEQMRGAVPALSAEDLER